MSLPLITFGQTIITENFTGVSAPPSSLSTTTSYNNATFVSPISNLTWTIEHCLNPNGHNDVLPYVIDGDGIIMRRKPSGSDAGSFVTSSVISGGISNFSIQFKKSHTSGTTRNVEIKIEDQTNPANTKIDTFTLITSSGADQTVHTFNIENLEIEGDFKIYLSSIISSGNQQITIDNLSWTSYTASTPIPCSIDNVDISALTCFDNGTGEISSDDKVRFTLNVTGTGGNGYVVSIPEYPAFGSVAGAFNTATEITLPEGSVGGADFTIVITAEGNPNCTFTSDLMVNEVEPCSTPASSCTLGTPVVSAVLCNTGADINDATDDFMTFDLTVTGDLTSVDGYVISADNGDLDFTTGVYGTATALQISNTTATTIVLTITDATDENCTTTVTITNPGTCSGDAVITNNVSTLTFTATEGNAIAPQTVTISGVYLTEAVVATASAGFEVSADATTFGSTATFALPTNSNTLPASILTVRSTQTAVGTTTGTVTLTSANAADSIINLTSTINGYTHYTIDQINGIESNNGVADSLNVLVSLSGVVQCMDYRVPGYSLVIVDASNKGINVYRGGNLTNYTEPVGGDSITVKGKIVQFRGLLQVEATEIVLHNSTAEQTTPIAVTALDETTENYPVVIENVTIVAGQTGLDDNLWPSTGNTNVKFTNGTTEFMVRSVGTPLGGVALPSGPVSITGIASQFASSTSAPFLDGYQLLICNENAIAIVCEGANLPNATINVFNDTTLVTTNIQGATYIWTNCDTEEVVTGATAYNFTPTVAGNYKVTIINGECEATSTCSASKVAISTAELGKAIAMFPNPVVDQLTINNYSDVAVTFTVTDMNGKIVTENTELNSVQTINTSSWNKGVYFVNFIGANNATHTMKVVK